MRAALAVVTALVAPVLGIGGTTAASATGICAPPAVAGFTVTSLSVNGITCQEAQAHAVHTIRHGAPSGWTCSHRVSGRSVSWFCHSLQGGGRSYHLVYHVH